ncbi:MAG: hypothetical protein OXE92_02145 [Bacteroidetes bacterium]|nr:hypothetical protein [Bacteroidota bacterium]
MLRVRFSFLALMGLFVVFAGYVPDVFGQLSSNVVSAIAVDTDFGATAHTSFVLDNASHVLLSDHHTKSTRCPLPAVELSVDPVRVVPASNILVDAGLSLQVASAPECALLIDSTRKQRDRYEECKSNLKCEGKGGWYTCQNEAGDEFSTCNAAVCGM